MFDFLGVGKTLKSFAEELSAVRLEIEATVRKIEDIQFAPAHMDDVYASLETWAAASADKYRQHLKRAIGGIVNRPGLDAVGVHAHLSQVEFIPAPSYGLPISRDMQLCGLLGPSAFVEMLKKQVETLDLPAPGLKMTDRALAVATLEKKMHKLRAREAELIGSAEKAGLSIS